MNGQSISFIPKYSPGCLVVYVVDVVDCVIMTHIFDHPILSYKVYFFMNNTCQQTEPEKV